MNTQNVATLFRTYCDEPDESFLSTADVALYCKIGYDQFLAFIDEVNPYVRLRGTPVILANARTYDLGQGESVATAAGTPSILGPNPNVQNNGGNFDELPRMTRLIEIYSMVGPANPTPVTTYNVVNNLNAVHPNGKQNVVQWSGNQLTFATNQNLTLMVLYNYEQDIGLTLNNPIGVPVGQPGQSWLTLAGGIINSVIDDNMQQWHDMIPLFAYAQYAIADAATSAQIVSRLNERKVELRDYLMQRSFGAVHHVHFNYDPSEVF